MTWVREKVWELRRKWGKISLADRMADDGSSTGGTQGGCCRRGRTLKLIDDAGLLLSGKRRLGYLIDDIRSGPPGGSERLYIIHMSKAHLTTRISSTAHADQSHGPGAWQVGLNPIGAIIHPS